VTLVRSSSPAAVFLFGFRFLNEIGFNIFMQKLINGEGNKRSDNHSGKNIARIVDSDIAA